MPTYTVKSPLKHNHKRYAVGQSIELDERESQALLVAGAVELDLSAAFAPVPAPGRARKAASADVRHAH